MSIADDTTLGIAVIGMAGRFPGAPDVDALWELIAAGREGLTRFSAQELRAAGTNQALLANPRFVPVGAVIAEADRFAADFFGIGVRDAQVTDPQQRLLLECAWHAMEHAGYAPGTGSARVGVYVGVGEDSYRQHVLAPHLEELLATLGAYRLMTVNGKDFAATRIAYKLGFTGPALSVQTACSTSLVAVHLACQSLHALECDLALAGGAAIGFPQERGYLYQDGMIASPDGHCRAFDAAAAGTAPGAGVGLVALKRLDEALADGDTIQAVILGSAINNDGADKVGFTAPSVAGQAEVIAEALAAAGLHPEDISSIEAHGTGTHLGDPIEVEALTQAFRARSQRRGWCAIGSLKTNIGHADTAAGVAGLIKTVLALKHRQLPPTLHFTVPNPALELDTSPFFVNTQLRPWEAPAGRPRCAAVSSFGIGGTNAHAVLSEAPPAAPGDPSRPVQLLTLSAKTPAALDAVTRNLATWLAETPEVSLADCAFTCNRGRRAFAYRRALVATDHADACRELADPAGLAAGQADERPAEVAFLFPGQGVQYAGMTHGLYAVDATFRGLIDDLAERLAPHLGLDLRALLVGDSAADARRLTETRFTQPVLFAVEYALARLWMHWGIVPNAMVGHSIGEYVAACLAGVLSLDDALALVAARGALIQSLPPGAMLALACSEETARSWLDDDLSLAAVNGPERCVLSGTPLAIGRLEERLHVQGTQTRRLSTSHAFHSRMLEPILDAFATRLRTVSFAAPRLPYLSNLTGTWMRPQDAVDPDYWVRHLRHTVRFADNLGALFERGAPLLLEVGPGQTLTTLARQHPAVPPGLPALTSLPPTRETLPTAELRELLTAGAGLWSAGATIDWAHFYGEERRRRVPLPLYPFERQRYWIDESAGADDPLPGSVPASVGDAAGPAVAMIAASPRATEPRTAALATEIAALWSQSLGRAVALNTDFFAAGGDSLLAIQLVAGLAERFAVALDAHTLLQAPTVEQLAALIAARMDREASPSGQASARIQPAAQADLVVAIQAGAHGRAPLVLLHPVGGHVYFYRELAAHIDPRLPVYGIRAQGAQGEAEPLTTIAAMAEVYIQALRTLQPAGPYHLAGASFGGTLAYAMAQRLVGAGERVDYLGLIDTPSTGNMPGEIEDSAAILHYLLSVGQRLDIDVETLRALDEDARIARFLAASGQDDTPAIRRELKITLQLFMVNLAAMRDYAPVPYPGRLSFFLARERDAFNAQTPAHGWIGLAGGGIEIHNVPGNHITMHQAPNVAQLGRLIRQTLPVALRR